MQTAQINQATSNIINSTHLFGKGDNPLDSLIEQWEVAKHDEERAKDQRLAIEKRILEGAILKESGSNRFGRLKITTGLTKKWDQVILNSIYADWAFPLWPFEAQWKEKPYALRTIEKEEPYAYAIIMDGLTVEPKKATFSIEN